MKIKSILLTVFAASVLAVGFAPANVLVIYNGGTTLGHFTDAGTLIQNIATNLVGSSAVTTDSSGNVYVGTGGQVRMYNIATGNFVRDILPGGYTTVSGLTFNPANPIQLIVLASYGDNSQLGIWSTGSTGSSVTALNGLGNGYTGLYYTDAIRDVAGQAIYAGTTAAGGLIQAFNSSTLAHIGNARDRLGTTGGVTGTASNLFYVSSSGGHVENQTLGANIITGLKDPRGIASDGATLWLAQTGNDAVGHYNVAGGLIGSFRLTGPTAIAYAETKDTKRSSK